jgi:hypothetical protein
LPSNPQIRPQTAAAEGWQLDGAASRVRDDVGVVLSDFGAHVATIERTTGMRPKEAWVIEIAQIFMLSKGADAGWK